MRRLLKISIVLFVFSALLFVFTEINRMRNQDSAGPEITMEKESISVSVSDPESALLSGIAAYDQKDGDVTASLVVEKLSNFLRKDTRLVTYAAFDKDRHVTKATREVTYTDYYPPEFAADKPFSFRLGDTDVLSGVHAGDCLDGNLSARIKILSDDTVSVEMPGEYAVTLQVANSAGDVSTLPVILEYGVSDSVPKILLSGYIRYLDPGEEFDPYGCLKNVQIGTVTYEVVNGYGNYGDSNRARGETIYIGRQDITVEGAVDTTVPGIYVITYSFTVDTGSSGPVTGKTRLYVIVRERPRNGGTS